MGLPSTLKALYDKPIIRTYLVDHVVFGIFLYKPGDGYTRFKRLIVLVCIFGLSFISASIQQSIEAGCAGRYYTAIESFFICLLLEKVFEYASMIPLATFCFSKKLPQKCEQKCANCCKCMDLPSGIWEMYATFWLFGMMGLFGYIGYTSSALQPDYSSYVCSGVGGVRDLTCTLYESENKGWCEMQGFQGSTQPRDDFKCFPSSQAPANFQSVQSGLVCTIFNSAGSKTMCNMYYLREERRCKIGTCVSVSADGIKDVTGSVKVSMLLIV
jgi:hypothetical protein